MKQKIDNLSERETAWAKTQLENTSKFVEGFSPADGEQPLTLGALDLAFAAWIVSEPITPKLFLRTNPRLFS
jgi:hypothetical protein